MTEKQSSYKYCLVPKCLNTNRSSPGKYFFPVPRHKKMRKRWCNAMKRIDREPLSYKTSLHCCQDHFNVNNDVENYVKYKLVGGRMVLKSGVLPHKFDCQLHDEINDSTPDIIKYSPLLPNEKQIEPLELVVCDLREDEINEMRNRYDFNEMKKDEFNDINRRTCNLNGVKKVRKQNHYKNLKFLCNIPFKIGHIDSNLISYKG